MLQSKALETIRIPEFRNLMLGRFSFIMGLRMLGTLAGWWIYILTSSPLAIGFIGLSEVIPAVGFALYAGYTIDISEKRKMLLRGVSFYLILGFILVMLSSEKISSQLHNHSIAVIIYAIIFCTGIIRSFIGPIFGVVLSSVVPMELLKNASAWNQTAWLSASVTGHAMAGILIGTTGIHNTLIVVCCLVIIGFTFLFRIKPKPALILENNEGRWESVKEGLRFVFKTKELLGALSLDLFAVLFGGATAMIPVFAKDILKVGAEGFGWLNAATDMGAIIVIITLSLFPMKRKQGIWMLGGVAGFGFCIIVFALSQWFWLSFFALFISGMLDGISVVVRGIILQLYTPNHMKGRVMSVSSMFINSSNELGQFESGLAAKIMGVIPSVVFGGCMTVAVVCTTWFKAPSLKKMEY